ncbi:MAG: toxin PIN [Prevotella sp.]|uniref:toxin PIN n=1 Tax=Prevotella sp. TaxID=59823 RepID=UPI002A2601DC|nr:toxin PIN [Prevotella sp.]MDD7317193.1 toxin PIN [Prevotellaceae bacterium]MDY4019797.1 toxin PIN [Prevotella sp.]
MTKLKTYVSPTMEVCRLKGTCLMASLSMGISDDPAVGGGDAKGNDFFDEEDASSDNTWEK